jgi:hypothetical protein
MALVANEQPWPMNKWGQAESIQPIGVLGERLRHSEWALQGPWLVKRRHDCSAAPSVG